MGDPITGADEQRLMMNRARKALFQRADIRVALYLFICVSSVYSLAMNGDIRGDGYYHYMAALKLLSGKPPVMESYRYFDVRAPLDKRGERTVQYGIGWTATLIPVALVYNLLFGRLPLPPENRLLRMVVSSTTSFISSGTAVLLYLTLRKMGRSRRACVLTALLLAFSTMLWTYSRGDLWTEPATAFAIAAALLAAVQHRKSGSAISAISAGLFVAYALTIKIYWVFLIAPFLVLLLVEVPHRRLRTVSAFFLPLVSALVAICFYNKLRFGVVVAEGYLGGALTLEAVGQAIKGQPLWCRTVLEGIASTGGFQRNIVGWISIVFCVATDVGRWLRMGPATPYTALAGNDVAACSLD